MNRAYTVILAVLIGVAGVITWTIYGDKPRDNETSTTVESPPPRTPTVVTESQLDELPRQTATIADTDLNLYVTTNQRQFTTGLSGTRELPADTGMLFYMPGRELLHFWMKDMYIPIDMLWLDRERKVIHIEADVSPDTYPKRFSNPPGTNAEYVLELNSGDAEKYGIAIGDELTYTGDVIDYLRGAID